MLLPGDCDDVSFFDPVLNVTHYLRTARLGLQGYIRAFKSEETLYRRTTAEAVHVAERLFSGSVPGATSVRRQCEFGVACLEVLCLLLTPTMRAFELLAYTEERSYALDGVLSLDSWDEGAASWPLFGMLALLVEHLDLAERSSVSQVLDPRILAAWDSWLETWHWDMPWSLQKLARSERTVEAHTICSPEVMAAAAAAEPTGSRSLAAVKPSIHQCRVAYGLIGLLQPSWARIWRGLDRLSSLQSVDVLDVGVSSGSLVEVTFPMSLLPPHVRGANQSENTFWFLADRIRSNRQSHCNPMFKVALEKLLAAGHVEGNINVWDVGAHLGDCCLWAGKRYSSRGIRCVAFERDLGAAQAIRRSIQLGNLGSSVRVLEGEVGPPVPRCRTLGPRSLDCVAESHDWIDFVHIHIGYKIELQILEGFVNSLREGKVGFCLVRATSVTMEDLSDFIVRHQLHKYTLVPVRQGHDVLLVNVRLGGW